jgi:hypothetical protein
VAERGVFVGGEGGKRWSEEGRGEEKTDEFHGNLQRASIARKMPAAFFCGVSL